MSGWQEHYAAKTVAVTGASGFIGGHLIRRLIPLCKGVVAFARGSATPLLPALAGARIVLGDVRNRYDLEGALEGADVIFHLAGHSGPLSSSSQPFDDLTINCGGLQNVLETVRSRGADVRIVFPGSRLQYGRVDSLPVREDAPKRPLAPYGVHKNFCEEYLEYYSRRFGTSYAVARVTNPYGSWPNAAQQGYNVINHMIQRALRDEPITIYGDGAQLRDYVHVDDVVEGLLLLGARAGNDVVNLGCGVGVAMAEMAETIVAHSRSGRVTFVPWPEDARSVETGDFVADISALRALGWNPRWMLAAGLREVIDRHLARASTETT